MNAILVRLAIAGVCLLSLARVASASVIYDVVVAYEGGYRYSFSMVFQDAAVASAIDANSALTADDLAGNDFLDEAFEGPDGPWTSNTFDSPSVFLSFLPLTNGLQFASSDSFQNAAGTSAFGFNSEFFELILSNLSGASPDWSETQITLRTPSAVPAAPTAALVVMGLVALRLRTLAASPKRACPRHVPA